MRVLLLHPDDSPLAGPWRGVRWDLVIDLGWAGRNAYAEWSDALNCRVCSYINFGEWVSDCLAIKKSLSSFAGNLVDSEKIDWWELLAALRNQQFLEFVLLQKLANEIGPQAEIRTSRNHVLAGLLGRQLGLQIDPFVVESGRQASVRLRDFGSKLSALSPKKIAGIAFDKWDTDYGARRFFSHLSRRQTHSTKKAPRILLPSAYRNVSRAQLGYANLLPDREFLLVATRADGIVANIPRHVVTASLAAYAPVPRNVGTEREIDSLIQNWRQMRLKLQQSDDALLVYAANLSDDFEEKLRTSLRIRDAWRAVFEREDFGAVLCADENNAYTRLPVMLAKNRGVSTVYCSHGALDGNVLIRGVCADVYLVKGEMEKDFLANQCAVPKEQIFVGAGQVPAQAKRATSHAERSHIVFFSEPYELYGGRTELLYRELLPQLCALARKHSKKVMLKLHPFESLRPRRQMVDRILNPADRSLIEVTEEPMSETLLQRTWASLTVESSVAVECALAGIPSFLCGWFDIDLYCYGRQYEKFGAATILHKPEEIALIPAMIHEGQSDEETKQRLSRTITSEELAAIFDGSTIAPVSVQSRAS